MYSTLWQKTSEILPQIIDAADHNTPVTENISDIHFRMFTYSMYLRNFPQYISE